MSSVYVVPDSYQLRVTGTSHSISVHKTRLPVHIVKFVCGECASKSRTALKIYRLKKYVVRCSLILHRTKSLEHGQTLRPTNLISPKPQLRVISEKQVVQPNRITLSVAL